MLVTPHAIRRSMRRAAGLEGFRGSLSGQLIPPGDPEYESARKLWNGMIDRYPALIVRCANRVDVANAVGFARECDLPVAVRGGGHNSAGNAICDGGLVIDLSRMKGVQVDPARRTARMEPGVTLGEFVQAIEAHGLLTTTGTVSGTRMAGLTLGGGM